MTYFLVFVFTFIFTFNTPYKKASARNRKQIIQVDETVSSLINDILKLVAEFHKIRVSKKNEQSLKAVEGLASELGRVVKLTKKNRSVQSLHITKVITSARDSLKVYKESPLSKNGKDSLKNFFKDIVQIRQILQIKKYKVFFCPKDKALWLQSSSKAKNPINLNYKNCGKRI